MNIRILFGGVVNVFWNLDMLMVNLLENSELCVWYRWMILKCNLLKNKLNFVFWVFWVKVSCFE